MNKQERKIIKYVDLAEACESREEAQTILKKHKKASAKLQVKRLMEDE